MSNCDIRRAYCEPLAPSRQGDRCNVFDQLGQHVRAQSIMRTDPARLAELQRLMALDTSPDRAYDDITRALAFELDAPITMVNLLDGNRDWFKSRVGFDRPESPIDTSFCGTFLVAPDELIVCEDTAADPRFAAHPLVVGPPFIRFYAAARLEVHGHTVGTLCAYDIAPKRPTPEQRETLRIMAGVVVDLLLLRRKPS